MGSPRHPVEGGGFAVHLPLIVVPENWPPMNRDAELHFIALLNDECAGQGLGPVGEEPCFVAAARRHARDMGVNGFTSHDGTDGTGPGERTVQEGCTSSQFLGEAAGHDDSPEGMLIGYLLSPLHRAIPLQPGITRIGVCVHPSAYGYAFVIIVGKPPPPAAEEVEAALLARINAYRHAALDGVARRAFASFDRRGDVCPHPVTIRSAIPEWAALEGYGGTVNQSAHIACLAGDPGESATSVAERFMAFAAERPSYVDLATLAQPTERGVSIVVDRSGHGLIVIITGDSP